MANKHQQTIVIDARMINNSGIGRYIQAIIPALIDCYPAITLLGVTSELQKYEWFEKVKTIELNCPIYSIKEQLQILLKTPKCDIFLSPHYNTPIYLPQAKKKAVIIPDANHLVFRSEFSFIRRLYATIFYKVAVGKDIIFTISDFSKSEIVKYTNCDPQKIIVGKLSIDKDAFKKLAQEVEGKDLPDFEIYKKASYLLFIGNIKPHKNLKRALLAFDSISSTNPELRFVIVGKRDNFLTVDSEVFKLVEQSKNLTEKVDFTGPVSDLHLAYLYKHSKAFLFPSLYEGFGLPPLEAMIFGCPVIVSREGSLPEICGDAAYYCDAYDVEDIAKAITEVVSNDSLRKKLITEGFKKVDQYDWSHFTEAVINGINKL